MGIVSPFFNEIEKRILAGERKAEIYAGFAGNPDAERCASVLAQIPTPAQRRRYSWLNWIFIAILAIMAALKTLGAAAIILSSMPKAFLLILIMPLINIWMIWLAAKFRALGYLLTICFCIISLSKLDWLNAGKSAFAIAAIAVNAVLLLAAMAIAWALLRKLLPQTKLGFALRPKTDSAGNPQFEE